MRGKALPKVLIVVASILVKVHGYEPDASCPFDGCDGLIDESSLLAKHPSSRPRAHPDGKDAHMPHHSPVKSSAKRPNGTAVNQAAGDSAAEEVQKSIKPASKSLTDAYHLREELRTLEETALASEAQAALRDIEAVDDAVLDSVASTDAVLKYSDDEAHEALADLQAISEQSEASLQSAEASVLQNLAEAEENATKQIEALDQGHADSNAVTGGAMQHRGASIHHRRNEGRLKDSSHEDHYGDRQQRQRAGHTGNIDYTHEQRGRSAELDREAEHSPYSRNQKKTRTEADRKLDRHGGDHDHHRGHGIDGPNTQHHNRDDRQVHHGSNDQDPCGSEHGGRNRTSNRNCQHPDHHEGNDETLDNHHEGDDEPLEHGNDETLDNHHEGDDEPLEHQRHRHQTLRDGTSPPRRKHTDVRAEHDEHRDQTGYGDDRSRAGINSGSDATHGHEEHAHHRPTERVRKEHHEEDDRNDTNRHDHHGTVHHGGKDQPRHSYDDRFHHEQRRHSRDEESHHGHHGHNQHDESHHEPGGRSHRSDQSQVLNAHENRSHRHNSHHEVHRDGAGAKLSHTFDNISDRAGENPKADDRKHKSHGSRDDNYQTFSRPAHVKQHEDSNPINQHDYRTTRDYDSLPEKVAHRSEHQKKKGAEMDEDRGMDRESKTRGDKAYSRNEQGDGDRRWLAHRDHDDKYGREFNQRPHRDHHGQSQYRDGRSRAIHNDHDDGSRDHASRTRDHASAVHHSDHDDGSRDHASRPRDHASRAHHSHDDGSQEHSHAHHHVHNDDDYQAHHKDVDKSDHNRRGHVHHDASNKHRHGHSDQSHLSHHDQPRRLGQASRAENNGQKEHDRDDQAHHKRRNLYSQINNHSGGTGSRDAGAHVRDLHGGSHDFRSGKHSIDDRGDAYTLGSRHRADNHSESSSRIIGNHSRGSDINQGRPNESDDSSGNETRGAEDDVLRSDTDELHRSHLEGAHTDAADSLGFEASSHRMSNQSEGRGTDVRHEHESRHGRDSESHRVDRRSNERDRKNFSHGEMQNSRGIDAAHSREEHARRDHPSTFPTHLARRDSADHRGHASSHSVDNGIGRSVHTGRTSGRIATDDADTEAMTHHRSNHSWRSESHMAHFDGGMHGKHQHINIHRRSSDDGEVDRFLDEVGDHAHRRMAHSNREHRMNHGIRRAEQPHLGGHAGRHGADEGRPSEERSGSHQTGDGNGSHPVSVRIETGDEHHSNNSYGRGESHLIGTDRGRHVVDEDRQSRHGRNHNVHMSKSDADRTESNSSSHTSKQNIDRLGEGNDRHGVGTSMYVHHKEMTDRRMDNRHEIYGHMRSGEHHDGHFMGDDKDAQSSVEGSDHAGRSSGHTHGMRHPPVHLRNHSRYSGTHAKSSMELDADRGESRRSGDASRRDEMENRMEKGHAGTSHGDLHRSASHEREGSRMLEHGVEAGIEAHKTRGSKTPVSNRLMKRDRDDVHLRSKGHSVAHSGKESPDGESERAQSRSSFAHDGERVGSGRHGLDGVGHGRGDEAGRSGRHKVETRGNDVEHSRDGEDGRSGRYAVETHGDDGVEHGRDGEDGRSSRHAAETHGEDRFGRDGENGKGGSEDGKGGRHVAETHGEDRVDRDGENGKGGRRAAETHGEDGAEHGRDGEDGKGGRHVDVTRGENHRIGEDRADRPADGSGSERNSGHSSGVHFVHEEGRGAGKHHVRSAGAHRNSRGSTDSNQGGAIRGVVERSGMLTDENDHDNKIASGTARHEDFFFGAIIEDDDERGDRAADAYTGKQSIADRADSAKARGAEFDAGMSQSTDDIHGANEHVTVEETRSAERVPRANGNFKGNNIERADARTDDVHKSTHGNGNGMDTQLKHRHSNQYTVQDPQDQYGSHRQSGEHHTRQAQDQQDHSLRDRAHRNSDEATSQPNQLKKVHHNRNSEDDPDMDRQAENGRPQRNGIKPVANRDEGGYQTHGNGPQAHSDKKVRYDNDDRANDHYHKFDRNRAIRSDRAHQNVDGMSHPSHNVQSPRSHNARGHGEHAERASQSLGGSASIDKRGIGKKARVHHIDETTSTRNHTKHEVDRSADEEGDAFAQMLGADNITEAEIVRDSADVVLNGLTEIIEDITG